MGKRFRKDKTDKLPLEQPAMVRLSDEDRERKQHEMVVKVQARKVVKREAKIKAREYRDELDRYDDEIEKLADQLQHDEEMRRNGDLFADQKALASVEEKATPEKDRPHAWVGDPSMLAAKADGAPLCELCVRRADDPLHLDASGDLRIKESAPAPEGDAPKGDDPAYNFDESEPAPKVIRSHAAIDRPQDADASEAGA